MNKEISLKKFLIVLSSLLIIEIAIFSYIKFKSARSAASERDKHCALAVCNESKTMCYNYDIDNDGKTVITWRGSCAVK